MYSKKDLYGEAMTIYVIPGRGYDSNIFLIDGKNPTIIDTGTGLNNHFVHKKICSYINPEEITQIILTHEHYDHVGGSKAIYQLTNNKAQILAHKYAQKKIESKESLFANLIGGSMPEISIHQSLKGGEYLMIGDHKYETIHTPGHTPGCICLYCSKTKTLFSGDTVFSFGSFGRTDLPGGSIFQLRESLENLSQLNINQMYPGHESIVENDAKNHILLSYKNICSLI